MENVTIEELTLLALIHGTQGEAIEAGKQMLQNQGGGEITVKGKAGKIRSKDSILPGHDPNPPKDKEH